MDFKVLLLSLFVALISGEKVRYDGFRLFRVPVENQAQLSMFERFSNDTEGYKFWSYPSIVGQDADVMVSPKRLGEFYEITKKFNMHSTVQIENVQELIDDEEMISSRRSGFGWTSYHRLEDIYSWMDSMAEEFPDIASVIVGGHTYENREIRGLKIQFDEKNPSLFIESNIHAREWITSATATWIIDQILRSEDRGILAKFNWYIFPVVNPDGFAYTKTTDRMWRKTRMPSNSICYGADPNRNWAYNFMQGGASSRPCDDTYAGSAPFSEPEMRTLSEYIATVPDLYVYIAFHSYTQLLMIPYGHTIEHLDNHDEADEIARKAITKLKERYGTTYKHGNTAETIYVASGTSMDWVKGILGTRFVYTYEFRDQGRYGFLLPPDQIIPNAEEVFDSLKVILEETWKTRN